MEDFILECYGKTREHSSNEENVDKDAEEVEER